MPTKVPTGSVKIKEVSKITTLYKKRGIVQQHVEREIVVPNGSVKHRKANAMKLIQEKVDNLEISPAVGNTIAKIVKNLQGRTVSKKPRWFITQYPAAFQFKRTAQTDLNALKLIIDMNEHPENYGIEEKHQKDDAYEKCKEMIWVFPINWPNEVLAIESMCKQLAKSQRHMQLWYEHYTGNECKLGKVELLKFLETEMAKHRKHQGESRSVSALKMASLMASVAKTPLKASRMALGT